MFSLHWNRQHRTKQTFPVEQRPRQLQHQAQGLRCRGYRSQEDAEAEPRQENSAVFNHSRTWHVQGRVSMDPFEWDLLDRRLLRDVSSGEKNSGVVTKFQLMLFHCPFRRMQRSLQIQFPLRLCGRKLNKDRSWTKDQGRSWAENQGRSWIINQRRRTEDQSKCWREDQINSGFGREPKKSNHIAIWSKFLEKNFRHGWRRNLDSKEKFRRRN